MKKYVKQVLVGLTPKQVKWLDKLSRDLGLARSEVLRRIIDEQREKSKTKG